MARINLLPWRERERAEKQREFLTLLGFVAIFGVLLVFAAHVLVNNRISAQEARNDFLRDEIRKVDRRIREIKELEKTKRALLDRMEIIQRLQRSRPEVVHLFDELVKTLPEGMYLTKVQQTGDRLLIEGKAESDARVSTYMRNLEDSPWFRAPRLRVIETREERDKNPRQNLRSFSLEVQMEHPGAPEDSERNRD